MKFVKNSVGRYFHLEFGNEKLKFEFSPFETTFRFYLVCVKHFLEIIRNFIDLCRRQENPFNGKYSAYFPLDRSETCNMWQSFKSSI